MKYFEVRQGRVTHISPEQDITELPDFSDLCDIETFNLKDYPDVKVGYVKQVKLVEGKEVINFVPYEPDIKEKFKAIGDAVGAFIDAEHKKEKYFHGFGFVNGQLSASKYLSDNPDAQKLSRWSDACWRVISEKKSLVIAGTLNIDDIYKDINAYLEANLPKIEDL